jgi:hypothetical protein
MIPKRKTNKGITPTADPIVTERIDIARNILLFGLLSVSILGIIAIIAPFICRPCPEKPIIITHVKDILTMLLPLIGTWVGTVMAFYFSKDNFKAAAESTRDLYKEIKTSEEKLKTIRVGDIMIKFETMTKLILDKKENLIKLKADIIDAIMDKDKNNPVNRLPVLADNLFPKYIIHRSLFDKFFVKMAMASKKIEDLTLADMSGDPDFSDLLTKSFGTIRADSNLADAKHMVDNVTTCQDVFVTETGESNSKVIGWITNVIIAKESII